MALKHFLKLIQIDYGKIIFQSKLLYFKLCSDIASLVKKRYNLKTLIIDFN